MSKEIAQTVGGKRIAWLIAILAAFAVMATLGTQWRSSSAALPATTVTVTQTTSSTTGGAQVAWTAAVVFNPSGSVAPAGTDQFQLQFDTDLTGLTLGSGNIGATSTVCTYVGNLASCTVTGAYTSASLVFTANNPIAGGTISQPTGGFGGTVCMSDITTVSCTLPTTGFTALNAVSVSPVSATNLLGDAETYTFSLPAGYTCASDDNANATRECAVSDVNLSAGLTLLSGPTVTDSVLANASTVTVTVINTNAASAGGTVSLEVSDDDDDGADFTSQEATKTYVGAEIRHIPDGVGGTTAPGSNTGTVVPQQEFNWNVRGSRHTVCAVQQNTGIDGADAGTLQDAPAVPVLLPGLTLANIVITNGGGYAPPGTDTDPTITDLRIFVGDGTALGTFTTSGLLGATCFSWVSTDAGDQQINLIWVGDDDGLNYNASWDTDGDGNGQAIQVNRALVKEWNRLEDSQLTIAGVSQGTAQNVVGSIGVTLNPATGLYQFTSVSIIDIFRGSHTNSAGVKEGPAALAGVKWTATLAAGSCGTLNNFPAGSGSLPITGETTLEPDGSVGGAAAVTFAAGGAGVNCGPGRTATINFVGWEPGPLGSGEGIIVTESVTYTFTTQIAAKQVFLAWAGQRIILEHDWRQPAGDVDGGTSPSVQPVAGSVCPFNTEANNETFTVRYIRGSGPGNFLPSLGAVISGNDQADVVVDAEDNSQTDDADPGTNLGPTDIVAGPNGSCISRVLYESEDQGQVDIEAFVNTGNLNVTKHAFVIYYMKINTINVSLATQFSKPNHNSSVAPDWANTASLTTAPSNPWDASKDDADNATEWNVSKDLLVRGRVTGWFTNSNPSGRARDDSNPLNVLPADRWVMPNDWALLAGGPADAADGSAAIGTAEQFRPYYDILFGPNQTSTVMVASPDGVAYQSATTVVAAATNTAASFRVASCSQFSGVAAGTALLIGGTTGNTFTSCIFNAAAGTSTLTVGGTGISAAPAAGTPIFILAGVPFEGPYSLLDIPGLAVQGKGGAALSDLDPNNIRDTIRPDGDVNMWDAPMPPAPVSVQIRGTGFIKQVLKQDVYYLGAPSATNSVAAQSFNNPFYIMDIPDSPFIPAIVVGGGYFWDTWGPDGPGGLGQRVYRFWTPAIIGTNSAGLPDTFTAAQTAELAYIRTAYGNDNTIARDLVVYTDNHGEFMVAANGDYRTNLTACATNVLALGKHCAPGDKVGTGTITATVDYPDFRGKHFPVLSNSATVDWTWGGYKDVTVEAGETDQFKYIVFHALDRDGFCAVPTGAVSLHPVYSLAANDAWLTNPPETVDFLIDSGEGIIINTSGGATTPLPINDGRQFAYGLKTYSWALNNPAAGGVLEFPLSPLAAEGQTDECQAWIKVSNSLLGVLNVLTIAHDDEGNIGFDRVVDLTNTHSYSLSFRWSLITWIGADAISVNDAIKGTGSSGKNPGGNDISASVTAIYGWNAAAQQWLGFFPSGVNVPGANDLTSLKTGEAYWIAITGPSSVTWTIASNVN